MRREPPLAATVSIRARAGARLHLAHNIRANERIGRPRGMWTPGRFIRSFMRSLVKDIFLCAALIIAPDLVDVNERALSLAEDQVLKRGNRQQSWFIVHHASSTRSAQSETFWILRTWHGSPHLWQRGLAGARERGEYSNGMPQYC